MGVTVIESIEGDCFACTTTDRAFGPLMDGYTGRSFLEWLDLDPRSVDPDDLAVSYYNWRAVDHYSLSKDDGPSFLAWVAADHANPFTLGEDLLDDLYERWQRLEPKPTDLEPFTARGIV